MAIKYEKKNLRQNNIVNTFIAVTLLFLIIISMVTYFYNTAEENAYELLHVQTKDIKDDLQLQLTSDMENLITISNFAATLYKNGEDYHQLFDSFKSIGLIQNIGVLTHENVFITGKGSIDLTGLISYTDEFNKGRYISNREKDLTNSNFEIIRMAVPINTPDKKAGILYGVIKLDTLNKRYMEIVEELGAQLFVYSKDDGNLIIDTIHDYPQHISILETRKYMDGFSYDQIIENDKGFSSFISAYTGEQQYVHYSTLEGATDWSIMLVRSETEVFAEVNHITNIFTIVFLLMALVVILYLLIIFKNEKTRSSVTEGSSQVRKLLLDINQQQGNIDEALKKILNISKARSTIFFNDEGESYKYVTPSVAQHITDNDEKNYLAYELFRYASELHNTHTSQIHVMHISKNNKLKKLNKDFYAFLDKHQIKKISYASTIDRNNHISVLGIINPKDMHKAASLLEEIAVCFSIAIFNKNHLNKTEHVAITDALTGAFNRVKYKKDIMNYDDKKPEMFSCLYFDVNELHIHNNKYGHAAGDEMLVFIANTLKEVFFGHNIYRMGGDEFLVFVENESPDFVNERMDLFKKQLATTNYHVSFGISFRSQNTNTEEMVREAELRMYEDKTQYYQNKESNRIKSIKSTEYVITKTGISEIDTIISIMNQHYNGIYRVSLETDIAHRILMPAYLGYNEKESHFSNLLSQYVEENVSPDFLRPVTNFLNYNSIKRQLMEGKTPRITYKKTDGETVILSVHKLLNSNEKDFETLWIFEKGK